MNWPTYPYQTDNEALQRHNARQVEGPPPQQQNARHGLAVDVWRAGVLLWRSWLPETADDLTDWARRTWGDDAPLNHDDGPWGLPGGGTVNWPIPSLRSLSPAMGLAAISDTLTAMVALAQLPSMPYELESVPSDQALAQRLKRSAWPYAVVPVTAGDVFVRALIGPAEPEVPVKPEKGQSERVRYHCSLEPRNARVDRQSELTARSDSFTLEAGDLADPAYLRKVIRLAKATLKLTGVPAQRDWQQQGIVWRLTDQPFNLVVRHAEL